MAENRALRGLCGALGLAVPVAHRASMAHLLEVRVHFLDPAVTELAALALPASARARGAAEKRLLRRAVAPLVPRQVVRGRTRGSSIPAARWLRGPLLPFAREVLAPGRIQRQGLLDPAAVTAMLDAHAGGREGLSRRAVGTHVALPVA